jgi:TolB-like protein
LRLDPLNEAVARRLMRLYSGGERRGAALDVYRTLEEALRKELGAEPGVETRAVFAEIARGHHERPAETRAPPPNPTPRSAEAAPAAASSGPAAQPPRKPAVSVRRWPHPRSAAVAGLLLLVVAYGSYWLSTTRDARPAAATTDSPAQPAPASELSIVVLPFTNLSGDDAQAYFSDGMTEEVTAALVKVPGLRVVARTSAFQFKDQGQDVRAVARSVGASHLVEGSVRRDGARVRVTAQLVEAESGTHLWAESYDRDYDNMFAIQDDIAKAIAVALRIPLGLQVDSERIGDLDTYQKFLRARAMVHTRGYGSLAEATVLLEQVVDADPWYAPAWAYLAQSYVFALNYHPAWLSGDFEALRPVVAVSMPKAERAARRAVELDPNLADGHAVLGLTLELRGDLMAAEDLYRKALVLDPANPDALHFYSRLQAEVGRFKEALVMRQQLQVLDPFVPVYNQVTSWLHWVSGETDAAFALDAALPAFYRGYSSPRLLASLGRYEEAAALIRTNPAGMFEPGVVEAAADLLRSAPTPAASSEALPSLGWFNFVYVHVGALGRTLEFYEGGVDVGYSVSISNFLLWHPYYGALRQTERYKRFMRDRGVVDYWRQRGWPELCRPIGDDFSCE